MNYDLEKSALKAYQAGKYQEAADQFVQLHMLAVDSDDTLKSAEIANNLAVILLNLNQPEQALKYVQGTAEIFAAAGKQNRSAQAHGNLASVLDALGQTEAAEKAYRQAIQLFEDTGDEDNRTNTLQSLSRLQLRNGRSLEAVGSMQSGLAGKSRLSFKERALKKLMELPFKLFNR